MRYALVEKLEIIMSSYAGKYIGSTPQHYDEFLGPLIFVDYAADIAQRVAAGNPFVKGYVALSISDLRRCQLNVRVAFDSGHDGDIRMCHWRA